MKKQCRWETCPSQAWKKSFCYKHYHETLREKGFVVAIQGRGRVKREAQAPETPKRASTARMGKCIDCGATIDKRSEWCMVCYGKLFNHVQEPILYNIERRS